MRKVNRQTDKLVGELLSLREGRSSIDNFNASFLGNFSDYARIMHFFLRDKPGNLFEIAFRQYFVFLVSCWETFFRDLFVYVSTKDQDSSMKLAQDLKVRKGLFDLTVITLPELLSKYFNFQNLNDLEIAYDSLWGANFLEIVCSTKTAVCGLNGKVVDGFNVRSLFEDWHSIVVKVFDMRNKIIHDANYRPEKDMHFVQRAESLFLLVPQIATYCIAEKFCFERFVFSDGKSSIPYIFNVHDLIDNNWYIVEDDEATFIALNRESSNLRKS